MAHFLEQSVNTAEYITDFQRYIHCGDISLFYCDIGGIPRRSKKSKKKKKEEKMNKKRLALIDEEESSNQEHSGKVTEYEEPLPNVQTNVPRPPVDPPVPVPLADLRRIRALTKENVVECMDIAKVAVTNGLVRKNELFKLLVLILRHVNDNYALPPMRSNAEPKRKEPKNSDVEQEPNYIPAREERKDEYAKKKIDRALKYSETIKNETLEERMIRHEKRKEYLAIHGKRKPILDGLVDLINTFDELTLFLHLYRTLHLYQTQKHSFPISIRKFVSQWYNKQDNEKLIYMLAKNRKTNSILHRDIFKLLHPLCVELTLTEAEENLFKKTLVWDYAIHRAGQFEIGSETVPPNNDELQKHAHRLAESCKLKVEKQAQVALQTMKEYNLCLEHLPSALIISKDMWSALFEHDTEHPTRPFITYSRLLQYLYLLNEKGFLEPNSAICQAVVGKLTDQSLLGKEKIHPFTLFHHYQMFLNNIRWLTAAKEKTRTERPNVNIDIHQALYKAFEMSFDLYPKKKGYKCFVTIDVRRHMEKKTIFSRHNHVISVLDAALIIAWTFMKISDECKIYTFGRDAPPRKLKKQMKKKKIKIQAYRENLEEIPDFLATVTELDFKGNVETQDMMTNFESLREVCINSKRLKKVVRSVRLPLAEALNKGKSWPNIFITITDGVCNVCPSGKFPSAILDDFRTKFDKTEEAKYVTIGLSHHKKHLEFEPNKQDKRCLEVAGFTSDTAKVIESFLDENFH